MLIWLSLLLAYGFSGLSQVTDDLRADPVSKPMWAMRPTLGMTLLVLAAWPTRPIQDASYSDNPPRAIAFALLGLLITFITTAGLIWCCLRLAVFFTSNFYLEVALSFGLIVALRFLAPIITLVQMPVILLLTFPLEFLFPLKSASDVGAIVWCKNCQHYKVSKEYEDTVGGLWRSTKRPANDKLPCKIAARTSEIWDDYFSKELNSRSLFPKNCPQFSKKVKALKLEGVVRDD